ncbi:uracil-DNA glycosylase [Mycoplasma sp. CSL10137]|uniref:uracil-DNA glycosylase n=1 Tax=unclassified Mycoplasma TaxID=2683645 RepID=UPI00197B92F3|nr:MULTISPECIES: uracil-DNA glycosylase [unclassified Mycoplasma]MBN4083329.1 uracil-DNA glycosylase [Mycoplasma sp. CSL10137]MBN4084368.1 uracil-DNA glycosylase [Mycoplasma sp. CSL10166]MBU4692854.1 uracil-DNA glycosylase [Mycoplasma sp. CSL7491-lung]
MKNSFLNILTEEGKKPYFNNIINQLSISEKENKVILPYQTDIFRAFEFFQVKDTKVIFIGQDPYHTLGTADGLAFSSRDKKTPPSLRNIFKELQKDYPEVKLETNSLVNWAKQGVLLLNTVLTVEYGKANSHKNIGWENFTLKVVEQTINENNNVIIVALGKQAQEYIKKLPNIHKISNENILATSHPSPFSYKRGFENFQLFKKINNLLKKYKTRQINWDLTKEVI